MIASAHSLRRVVQTILSTRVYTYNMPDAIDARLASLTLSGVDIGEF